MQSSFSQAEKNCFMPGAFPFLLTVLYINTQTYAIQKQSSFLNFSVPEPIVSWDTFPCFCSRDLSSSCSYFFWSLQKICDHFPNKFDDVKGQLTEFKLPAHWKGRSSPESFLMHIMIVVFFHKGYFCMS